MRSISPIGHDELPSETRLSQLGREFRMTLRKLHRFSTVRLIKKSSWSLELGNQSSRVTTAIVKAGALGEKGERRTLFATPFGAPSKISRPVAAQAGPLILVPNR